MSSGTSRISCCCTVHETIQKQDGNMQQSHVLVVLLGCVSLAAGLRCYTCLFPAISPLDCFKFPQECPAGQRCLFSEATGRRGALSVTMYEKSCAVPSQCGVSGQKYSSGLYFNYTNLCCDTDLCNSAPRSVSATLLLGLSVGLPVLGLLL
ncbi:hypothetical protein WMY93_015611 [Mugilogobius chulae]|uniref:UPAR/Ly6 domain-containing protein n=1 Tax=Mugilogobius chulae TaxID=88201 RepID=A0AAW0NV86_9GOBI